MNETMMSGYESLTPDQIIYICTLIFLGVVIYSLCRLIGQILVSRSIKYLSIVIQTKTENEQSPPLISWLKKKLDERKKGKMPKNPYIYHEQKLEDVKNK